MKVFNKNSIPIWNVLLTIYYISQAILIHIFRIVNSKMLVPQQRNTTKCWIRFLRVVNVYVVTIYGIIPMLGVIETFVERTLFYDGTFIKISH